MAPSGEVISLAPVAAARITEASTQPAPRIATDVGGPGTSTASIANPPGDGRPEVLATRMAPGQVFAGTDYPYLIMQKDPARWVRSLALPVEVERSICAEAAGRFMAEDLIAVIEAEA